ncbi:MAG: hypothetical protein HYS22_03005 [Deltaproteobacteria bacterium]|nr:hypothetical protein [Deltaproteobacteria bacterium]
MGAKLGPENRFEAQQRVNLNKADVGATVAVIPLVPLPTDMSVVTPPADKAVQRERQAEAARRTEAAGVEQRLDDQRTLASLRPNPTGESAFVKDRGDDAARYLNRLEQRRSDAKGDEKRAPALATARDILRNTPPLPRAPVVPPKTVAEPPANFLVRLFRSIGFGTPRATGTPQPGVPGAEGVPASPEAQFAQASLTPRTGLAIPQAPRSPGAPAGTEGSVVITHFSGPDDAANPAAYQNACQMTARLGALTAPPSQKLPVRDNGLPKGEPVSNHGEGRVVVAEVKTLRDLRTRGSDKATRNGGGAVSGRGERSESSSDLEEELAVLSRGGIDFA